MGRVAADLRPGPQLPGPGIAPHVEDRGHPRAEQGAEEELGMALEVGDHLLIGVALAHIHEVGAAICPAGLGEVHVAVDEAGSDPVAGEIDGLDTFRNRALLAPACASDPLASQEHDGVGQGSGAGAVDQRGALEDESRLVPVLAGPGDRRRCGERKREERRQRIPGPLPAAHARSRSALAAQTKSLSVRPSILWVQILSRTLPQVR